MPCILDGSLEFSRKLAEFGAVSNNFFLLCCTSSDDPLLRKSGGVDFHLFSSDIEPISMIAECLISINVDLIRGPRVNSDIFLGCSRENEGKLVNIASGRS